MRAVMLIGTLISLLIVAYLTMTRSKMEAKSAARAAAAQGMELPKAAKGDIRKLPAAVEQQMKALKKKQKEALEALP